jgi:prepilin-type N-terminal cleavage/methylation domain-containing protein
MNKGFTLIEVIIVICIILLLFVIVWPIGASFYRQQIISKADQQVVSILKQARANAINQKNNAAFGVELAEGQAVLFQGNTFDSRIISEDITYTLPKIAVIGGLNEIVFLPNTGFVDTPGSIIIGGAGANKEIKINRLGVIDY